MQAEVPRPAEHFQHALDGDALADAQQHGRVAALHSDVDSTAAGALHLLEDVGVQVGGMRRAGPLHSQSDERVAQLVHAAAADRERVVEKGERDEVGALAQLADFGSDRTGAAIAEAAAGDVVGAEGARGGAAAAGKKAGGRNGFLVAVPARIEQVERVDRRGQRVEIEQEPARRVEAALVRQRADVVQRALAVERVAQLGQRLLALAAHGEIEPLLQRLERRDRRVRAAADQLDAACERARQRVRVLRVERLAMDADQIGRELERSGDDLDVILRRELRAAVEQRDLVTAPPQGRREVEEREQRGTHRLVGRRVDEKEPRHGRILARFPLLL